MKNGICLLGATGSIGLQTLDVLKEKKNLHGIDYQLISIGFNNNIEEAIEIINEYHPSIVYTPNIFNQERLKKQFPEINITDEIKTTITKDIDIVVNALVGSCGLIPTIEAIRKKKILLLANKESLVMAGDIVMEEARINEVPIIPIDSEHSAIFQIINDQKVNNNSINKLIITASGGSLYHKTQDEINNITLDEVLKHPNWKMGKKITIDSATMVNKGFEVIEAFYLFNIPLNKIEVIIHPESIIHSMVEYNDYAIMAQMGVSDMRLPIAYAYIYAIDYLHKNMNIYGNDKHIKTKLYKSLDLSKIGSLHFNQLDEEQFPLFAILKKSLEKGNFYPTVINSANEVLVNMFIDGKIQYIDIIKGLIWTFDQIPLWTSGVKYNLENILLMDKKIKEEVSKCQIY